MKILFDLLSQQDNFINGGSLYGLRLFSELLKCDVEIIGLCDKNKKFNEEAQFLIDKYGIEQVDIKSDLFEFCRINDIDCVVITIAQRYNNIDLSKIDRNIVIVCHDVVDMILGDADCCSTKDRIDFGNEIQSVPFSKLSFKQKIKKICVKIYRVMLKKKHHKIRRKKLNAMTLDEYSDFFGYENLKKLIKKSNVQLVTVSEHSKAMMEYYFQEIKNEIKVFHAHSKIFNDGEVGNEIREFLLKNPKYFLMISVDRPYKNLYSYWKQMKRMREIIGADYICVTIGKINKQIDGIINFDKVNTAELNELYKHAQIFIYPSLSEGYGSPPVEAMRFGIPVIAAYSSSLPEVLGDAAEYFNPFFHQELYRAIRKVLNNRQKYVEKSEKKYKEIFLDQEKSLLGLIELIKNKGN